MDSPCRFIRSSINWHPSPCRLPMSWSDSRYAQSASRRVCKAPYPTIGVGWEVNYQTLSHPFPRDYGAADTDSTRTSARRPSYPGVLDSTRPRGPGLGELLAGWAPVLLFAVFPLSALGEHETEILGGPDRSFIPLAAETADVICLEERLVKRTKLILTPKYPSMKFVSSSGSWCQPSSPLLPTGSYLAGGVPETPARQPSAAHLADTRVHFLGNISSLQPLAVVFPKEDSALAPIQTALVLLERSGQSTRASRLFAASATETTNDISQ